MDVGDTCLFLNHVVNRAEFLRLVAGDLYFRISSVELRMIQPVAHPIVAQRTGGGTSAASRNIVIDGSKTGMQMDVQNHKPAEI